ncbi:hypothetical protein EVAR_58535_1 [Eumeta japonica]|uniref:Uncharacterized protein n=1 Tax=Eumeta variegata TaxID=151549 RepID=A0A4C1Z6E6_EUMVA|nr:hypothetical protein EVAR_58535_1 [Eumeta japonica]
MKRSKLPGTGSVEESSTSLHYRWEKALRSYFSGRCCNALCLKSINHAGRGVSATAVAIAHTDAVSASGTDGLTCCPRHAAVVSFNSSIRHIGQLLARC